MKVNSSNFGWLNLTHSLTATGTQIGVDVYLCSHI